MPRNGDVRAIEPSAKRRRQRVVELKLIDDEMQILRNVDLIAATTAVLGMDGDIAVARPMSPEVAVAESRIAETVREDDDGVECGCRSFGRHTAGQRAGGHTSGCIDVHRNMALPLRVEPIEVVLDDAIWAGACKLCELRIGQRPARNRCARGGEHEATDCGEPVHIQDSWQRRASGGTLAARVPASRGCRHARMPPLGGRCLNGIWRVACGGWVLPATRYPLQAGGWVASADLR